MVASARLHNINVLLPFLFPFSMMVPSRSVSLSLLLGVALLSVLRVHFSQFANYGRFLRESGVALRSNQKLLRGTDSVDRNDGGDVQLGRQHQNRNATLAIVTALSDNHLMEGVSMLRSLIRVGYTGPVYVYIMRQVGEEKSPKFLEFQQELDASPLRAHVFDFIESEPYWFYCFKPKVVERFLNENRITEHFQYFMWTDTSTRFAANPQGFANGMQREAWDFVGKPGLMGMGENTHEATYQHFGLQRQDYKEYIELASGHFIVNLRNTALVQNVVEPWIECAKGDQCTKCMAPKGSLKKEKNGLQWVGPPNDVYVSHRQDQSALGLLVYKLQKEGQLNVRIENNNPLMNITTDRHKDKGLKQIKEFYVL